MNKFNNMKGEQAYITLKLDMEKACDILEWDFIFSYLKGLGLNDMQIEQMCECIRSVSYSIIVNDELCGFILLKKDLAR